MTGLLGGFTTFSSFSLEAVNLLHEGHTYVSFIYILLSLSLLLNDNYPDRRIDSFKNLTLDYCFFIVNLYKSSFLFLSTYLQKSLISSSNFTSFLLSPLRNSSLKSSNMINMKFFRIFTYQLV